MNALLKLLCCAIVATLLIVTINVARAAVSNKEARVTQVVQDVKLLPADAQPRVAAVNDQVREGIAVRTGDKSRSELTFADLTISRLGANTIFSFNKAGRSVQLDGGSILVRVPKDSGGGNVRTNTVSVAITGTTLILETTRAGRNKLIVLEGNARLSLVKYRGQWRDVRGGQMLDVPAGATELPMPQNIDVNQVMKTHPLIVGFPPLPSRNLIADVGRRPPPFGPGDEPVYPGRPAGGAPIVSGGLPFPGIGLPPIYPGRNNPGRPPGRGNPSDPGDASNPPGATNPGGGTTVGGGGKVGGASGVGALPTAGTGQAVGGSPQAPGGATNPILRRAPARKIAVPRSTPTPIR